MGETDNLMRLLGNIESEITGVNKTLAKHDEAFDKLVESNQKITVAISQQEELKKEVIVLKKNITEINAKVTKNEQVVKIISWVFGIATTLFVFYVKHKMGW